MCKCNCVKRRTRKEKIQAKIRRQENPRVEEVVEEKADTKTDSKMVIKDLVRTGVITLGLFLILGVIYWRLK